VGLKESLIDFFSYFKISRETALKYFSLLGIFFIALSIRIYVILRYGISLRAYDTFIQYRAAKFIEEHGLSAFLQAQDFLRWYPWGSPFSALYIGVPITGAYIHKLLLLLGINVDLYTVVSIIPGIFGALTVFPAYLLAKEFKSERAGLFAAYLVAISPGVFQRSMPGFYDNESIGIFLILLILWLFVKSIKTGSMTYSIVGGLSLGFLGLTWGLYRYVYDLLALYLIIAVLSDKLDSKAVSSAGTFLSLSLAIMILIPRNYGLLTRFDALAVIAALLLLYVYGTVKIIRSKGLIKKPEQYWYGLAVIVVLIAIGTLVLYALGYLAGLEDKFSSVINPFLRKTLPTFSSVSENQPATWSVVFLGSFVSGIIASIAFYFAIERRFSEDILLVITILTAYYFSASISRFIVIGAALLSIAAGIGLDYLLDPFVKIVSGEWIIHHVKPIRAKLGEMRITKSRAATVYIIVAFVLIAALAHGVYVTQSYGAYDITEDEQYIFTYLRTYAKPTDVVLSWWDYGYRLSVFANVTTLADNGTGNSTQMGIVGAMLMLPENESIKLMKKYNVKWIVVYGVDVLKAIWMIRIAEKHAPMFNITEKGYFDNSTGKYKEPFFHSLLWSLIAYNEDPQSMKSLIEQLGTDDVKEKSEELATVKLHFVEFVARGPSTTISAFQRWVKLYRVVYREEGIPPAPPSFKNITRNETSNITKEAFTIASQTMSQEIVSTHEPYSIFQTTEIRRFHIYQIF